MEGFKYPGSNMAKGGDLITEEREPMSKWKV